MSRLSLTISLFLLSISASVWSGCSGADESPTPSSPTPSTPTSTPQITPGPTPSATPNGSPTPTSTPSLTPTATPGLTPTATPGLTPTATPGTTPTSTPELTPTATPEPTPTPTLAPTPTQAPTPTLHPDVDDDGFSPSEGDCNDEDPAVYPGALEIVDGKDNNCDGKIDDKPDPIDNDLDGFSEAQGDCNDQDKSVYPGGNELPYDGIDQDCSGADLTDVDQDGFDSIETGDPAALDCDDENDEINPEAIELCNGIDDNCDDQIDEGVILTWYNDQDTDTFGNASVSVKACAQPTGYVSNSTDCNDSDKNINPNASEVCDSKDNDCDGKTDDADSSVSGQSTWYRDSDTDTFGSASSTTKACAQPTGYVSNSTDCNDSDKNINPNASEVCDGVDNNCAGGVDDGLPVTTYYKDGDNDGYGTTSTTSQSCSKPSGFVTVAGDCNDNSASVNPNASETCNDVDDNCNGQKDEESASTCPGTDGACQVRSCQSGSCGFVYTAAGTEVADPVSGDCKSNQCDGAGNIVAGSKDVDKPNDSNGCTLDACSGGVPAYTNVSEGAACTDNGGTTCDGAGSCTLSFVVLQVGDGVNALAATATQVTLEEKLLSGAKVNRTGNPLLVPSTSSSPNFALTLGGTATSEGQLSRSEDGRYLVFGGYNTSIGSTAGSSTVARTLARMDGTGTLDTSTQISTAFSGATLRGATSANGSGIWASGSTGGVQYATFGSTGASTQVLSTPANMRWLNATGGQLYGSSGSGVYVNVFQIGTNQPTTTGATATSFPGMPTASASPYGFVLLDLNTSVTGPDTLYVADDSNPSTSVGGVQKWTFNGTTWTKVTTFKSGLGTIGVRGLTGKVMSNKVYLIAITADATTSSNKAVLFVDDGVNLDPAATVLATSPTKTQYRGVALPPR